MKNDRVFLRDLVLGPIAFIGWETNLLQTAEIARLKEIKQLSTSFLFHQNATHTRYDHAIGTAWRVRFFLDALPLREIERVNYFETKRILTAAALLHDIGHPPWSHTGERYARYRGVELRDKQRSRDLILDSEGKYDRHFEPWARLKRIRDVLDLSTRQKVAQLVLGNPPVSEEELRKISDETQRQTEKRRIETEAWMGHLINGQPDMDRSDYLTRDAHFTFTTTQMLIDPVNAAEKIGISETSPGVRELVFLDQAFAESFLLAREFMYQAVYLESRRLVADELLVRALFKGLTMELDEFWFSTDQRTLEQLKNSNEKLVSRFLDLLILRRTYDIVYDSIFNQLEEQQRRTLEKYDPMEKREKADAAEAGPPKIFELEKMIFDVCQQRSKSINPDDFLLAISIWPPAENVMIQLPGQHPTNLYEISPLYEALSSQRYLNSRSRLVIGVNPDVNQTDRDILIEATRTILRQRLP